MKQYFNISLVKCAILIFIVAVLSSCNADDTTSKEYKGENKIHINPTTSTFIKDNGDDELAFDILLVKATNEPITLQFELENNTADQQSILELLTPTVTLATGEKKAQVRLKSKSRRAIKETTSVVLHVVHNSSTLPIAMRTAITILPLTELEALTPQQIILLDLYKAKGLDLYPLIGEISAETKIDFPGGSTIDNLNTPQKLTVKGKTVLTLSDKATAQQPVLKMVSNAMGIENYLYSLFRNETIDDLTYWNNQNPDAPPANKEIMQLINLTRLSAETFEVLLDDIRIDLHTKEISFIAPISNLYNSDFEAVPFQYKYSAWTRLQKLLAEGNPFAIENYEMGGSVNPADYINTEQIIVDDYNNDTWKETKATWTENKLNFRFIMWHQNADGYIYFSTEYTL